MDLPFTSFVCVTRDRPAHMLPMLTQFLAQQVPKKELIIVDNSDVPWGWDGFLGAFRNCGLQYRRVVGKRMVGELRNIGMSMAHGDLIAWLDDDDWRHPQSVKILWEVMLQEELDIVGPASIWFADENGFTRYWTHNEHPAFGATLFNRKVMEVTFLEQVARASDTSWLRSIAGRDDLKMGQCPFEFILVAVCHGKNISNPDIPEPSSRSVADLDREIGSQYGLKRHVDRLFQAIKAEEFS